MNKILAVLITIVLIIFGIAVYTSESQCHLCKTLPASSVEVGGETLRLCDDCYKKITDAVNEYDTNDISKEKTKEEIDAEAKADEEAAKAAKIERKKYEPQKIVDSGGKQIWKIYISDYDLHFTGTYKGTGNFIVKLSDSNQDLLKVIANEIGDFIADKTVNVSYDGWYYLEIYGSDGEWTYNWD